MPYNYSRSLNQKLNPCLFQLIFTKKKEGRLPLTRLIHLIDHLPHLIALLQGKFSFFTALQDDIQSIGKESPDIEENDLPDISGKDLLVVFFCMTIGGFKINPLIGQDKFTADLCRVG
jgi:hypothetical protein